MTDVELSRLQPDIFALGAHLAAFGNDLARGDHLLGVYLERSGGDPTRRMLWVGLDDRVEQRTRALDVAARSRYTARSESQLTSQGQQRVSESHPICASDWTIMLLRPVR